MIVKWVIFAERRKSCWSSWARWSMSEFLEREATYQHLSTCTRNLWSSLLKIILNSHIATVLCLFKLIYAYMYFKKNRDQNFKLLISRWQEYEWVFCFYKFSIINYITFGLQWVEKLNLSNKIMQPSDPVPECSHFTFTGLKETGAAPLFKAFVSFLLLIILPFFFFFTTHSAAFPVLFRIFLSRVDSLLWWYICLHYCKDRVASCGQSGLLCLCGAGNGWGVISLELCWLFSAHGSECVWIK